jgi:coenzyme F420-0:L-glutamate ligase / coenzyme F420-1:gamma-L-glutamate ligase
VATSGHFEIFALEDFPLVQQGDKLEDFIVPYGPQSGDIIVVAQKVVSKSEGRLVPLPTVKPSDRAHQLATITGKDPRVIELILSESKNVLRAAPGLMIVEHRLGFIMANAGIDASNVGGPDQVLLLPEDPDQSARQLAASIKSRTGTIVGVVITDSWGRPWRVGTIGFAIGAAGVTVLRDMRGEKDLDGRELKSTQIATADEIAAAASLLMGQADEGRPVVVLRGLSLPPGDGRATDLVRSAETDQFR